jgi:4-hydroxy-2-oxoheptanedioate aldolase
MTEKGSTAAGLAANRVRAGWREGRPAFGGWLSIPRAFSAELMARVGFDYVCIDMQHGLIDYQVAVGMLQAIGATDTVPFVRVPWNDFATINKVLDAGAHGVIVPMVNSPEEARAAVSACRYPPDGERSFGPARAAFSAGPDYFAGANAGVTCIPMVETRQAVERIDDILAVPGIDAVYVGPNDLSLTLGGGPGLDQPGAYQDAHQRIAKACAAAGIVAGIHANAALAPKHVAAGYRMITVSSDMGGLFSSAARDLRAAREG